MLHSEFAQRCCRFLPAIIDSYNEPQPIVITYPYPKSMYNITCTNVNKKALKGALKLENPATADVLIDHLGLLSSEGKKL